MTVIETESVPGPFGLRSRRDPGSPVAALRYTARGFQVLGRDVWLDLARQLDGSFSYVREEEEFPVQLDRFDVVEGSA